MTLVADSNGVIHGKFTIPANVPAGTKEVYFEGSGGSSAGASFFGQGVLETDTRTAITTYTYKPGQANYGLMYPVYSTANTTVDPIAQTFTVNTAMQIDAVDLFFNAVGATDIEVQIRSTQVGFPTRETLASARLRADQVSAGQWTKFTFAVPAGLDASTEYAIVVLCNDADSELAVAELGKFDANLQQWVTSQPYTIGVLLSSSNASTWTAWQDRDLAFRLYARRYTETERVIDLGAVPLSGATDLLLRSLIDTPATGATGQIEIALSEERVINATDGQCIQLAAPVTGDVALRARLRATEFMSAALYPGAQLIEGKQAASANYVSAAIEADPAGCAIRLIFDAAIPSGANLAGVILHNADAPWNSPGSFVDMTPDALPKLLEGNIGYYEYAYRVANATWAKVQAELIYTGTAAARPYIQNFRMFSVLQVI